MEVNSVLWFALQGKKGLILVRTQTLVLAATYTESMYPSVCVEAVERLGKLLSLDLLSAKPSCRVNLF